MYVYMCPNLGKRALMVAQFHLEKIGQIGEISDYGQKRNKFMEQKRYPLPTFPWLSCALAPLHFLTRSI